MSHNVIVIRLPLPFRVGTVNCYLIRTGTGHVLIDTGPSNARGMLVRALEKGGCLPGFPILVLLTHGDFDHIGNAAYLHPSLGARIAMQPDDAGMAELGDMFVNRTKTSKVIRALLPAFARFGTSERFVPDILLDDGHDLAEQGLEARVISLPGHSRGSIGILTRTGELFCGDLFDNTKRPALNPLMDDPEAAEASLARLRRIDITTVYPGHGESFGMEMLGRDEPWACPSTSARRPTPMRDRPRTTESTPGKGTPQVELAPSVGRLNCGPFACT